MASSDHSPADEAFERMLLRSASADGPSPEASREAWAKLSLAAAGAATLAAGGGLAATSIAAKKTGAWVAAKWLLIGAASGSAVTAALMQDAGSGEQRARVVRAQEAPVPAVPEPAPHSAPLPPAPEPPGSSRAAPVARVHTSQKRVASAAPSAGLAVGPAPAPQSTLGAEVAMLDAARRAIAMGTADDALRLIGEYRRTFPGGALAADAEVIAIDSMTARHQDVTAQADRFLSRFPNDPHAARIRKLSSSR